MQKNISPKFQSRSSSNLKMQNVRQSWTQNAKFSIFGFDYCLNFRPKSFAFIKRSSITNFPLLLMLDFLLISNDFLFLIILIFYYDFV